MKVAVKEMSKATFLKSAKFKATNKQFTKQSKNYKKCYERDKQQNNNNLKSQFLTPNIKLYTKFQIYSKISKAAKLTF